MADLVMGAVPSIIAKLYQLLKEEYKLQTGVKERISSLTQELESAQAALRKVGKVPWDQLDEQVQIWARQVREASYDMEDVLDTFHVWVKSPDSTKQKSLPKRLVKKITNLFTKSKARHEISVNTKDIMSHLEEVTERCRRYKVGDIGVATPDTTSAVDPRLHAMYNKVEDLVGIDKSSGELISILQSPQREGASHLKKKIVVIVGVGGLGKTTLAKAVYDKLKGDFKYTAFVPVGRKPNPQQVIRGILIQLDSELYMKFNFAALQHISEFINELLKFLHGKRYFIVIDDLWEKESWETIKLAFDDNNCDSRIIITTRNREVSEKGYVVYDLPPLPHDSSRELFFIRIGCHEGELVDNKPDKVTFKFLKKCAGIPLAIITMASLLAGKPRERWGELYRSIGFGSEDSDQSKDTMRIVSFSYYDLPAHLRTCLLYLSAFPEDSVIPKDSLVWMWVAEGFVKKKQGMRLFETGEGYFHDLINRSLLEAVKSSKDDRIVTSCRVHDMVLEFIRSMSEQENFFTIVLDNEQGSLQESNNIVPRRLAHHNRTMGHGHDDDLNMAKVRSMFAISCGMKVSDPFHGFALLRVLVIDCMETKGSFVFRNEHVRNLLHLRFLSIRGTLVNSIPEEIGRLRFLQVLDLKESFLKEWQSLESLPPKLLCLWLPIGEGLSNYYGGKFWVPSIHSNDDIFSLTRLTSLEELSVSLSFQQVISWHLPTELRVLKLSISGNSEATAERNFWECVRHLNRLEHLTILGDGNYSMHVTDFILPGGLRHFAVGETLHFCKLPSCFSASCLSNLSHLELKLELDEYDLKMLGRLPELRFLRLAVYTIALVSIAVVVSEKDAALVYFPKLQCWELLYAMVSFHTNEEDKSISFQMWNGHATKYIGKPSVSEDKMQSTSTSGGRGGCASGIGATWDCFMPSLQVFRIKLPNVDRWGGDRHWDNIGFECCLPSLRKMDVSAMSEKATEALRCAAEAHPNHPVFCVGTWWQEV